MKIGILGGTFDPIHNGHLAVAKEVRSRLSLDEILFVPTGQPWRKGGNPIQPAEHRVEMVRLAIAGKPYYRLSLIEVDRKGPSYTLDTLTDQSPEQIIRLCHLVAVPRPGYSHPDLDSLEIKVPGLTGRVVLLDRPEVDISATEIRERVAQGLPINGLVPEAVEEYIRENGLYSTEKGP
jgi:nicotinate-nucleotide adenylyltransferase